MLREYALSMGVPEDEIGEYIKPAMTMIQAGLNMRISSILKPKNMSISLFDARGVERLKKVRAHVIISGRVQGVFYLSLIHISEPTRPY